MKPFSAENIDLDAVIAATRKLADENPTLVYEEERDEEGNNLGCLYMPTLLNPTGCIMGAAFTALGIELPKENYGIDVNLRNAAFSADDQRIEWLNTVQARQDEGSTWRAAVDEADAEVFPESEVDQ